MAVQQIGPLFYINGPLPRRPKYGLVVNADVIDEGDEHWANGIQVHGYIPDCARGWSVCGQIASPPDQKASQETANPLPEFGPLTAYLTETCSTRTMEPTQEAFKARASTTFSAVEGAVVEDQFWSGTWLPDNPHLADANADVLNNDTATSITNGLALLENAIAATCRGGVIHMTPGLAIAISTLGGGGVLQAIGGALYTVNGTLVIPGYGYDGSAPEGSTDVSGTEEFAYATGPVEVLRSDAFVMPPEVAQAVDRAQNTIEYRAERYYIPFWDTQLQAGVRIDRCFLSCDGS